MVIDKIPFGQQLTDAQGRFYICHQNDVKPGMHIFRWPSVICSAEKKNFLVSHLSNWLANLTIPLGSVHGVKSDLIKSTKERIWFKMYIQQIISSQLLKGTGSWLSACSFIKMLFFCRDILYRVCKQYDHVIMLSKNQSALSPGSHLHLINLNICK